MSSRVADVIIIGGGVVGCATAYYLAKNGNNNVIVFYSGGNNIEICCWNKEITEKVVKSLREEITKFSVK